MGITMAAMIHTAAACPNMTYDADAHYHHLRDDYIVDGPLKCVDGCYEVPDGPGLGVTLDPDKLAQYAAYFEEVGDYYQRYHEDARRPDWFPLIPQW